MICTVCGQDYGVAHNCAGVAAFMTPEEAAPPPSGFDPIYYLRLAFNIARWDDVAIRRASRDSNAIGYGMVLWTLCAFIILLGTTLPRLLARTEIPGPALLIALIPGLSVGLAIMAFVTLLQLGLCHLIAKSVLGGKGTYLQLMRPLLLGWCVNVLILIPVLGPLAAGIAWVAVLMLVFEEVEGIERIQAFFISAGVNVCFFVLQLLLPVHRAGVGAR
jgi:hypothetical protein